MKHLIILASVVAVGLCMPGGWSQQNASDPQYMAILTDLQTSGLISSVMDGAPKLLKVQAQVVSGMNYNFTLEIGGQVCYIRYYEQSWTNTHKIEEDTCSSHKRQLAGGYTTQDASDPEYRKKLTMLATKGLITLPPSDGALQIVAVKTQVVAGMNYMYTLKVEGHTCQIVYYEVPWLNKHEITSDTCSSLTHKRQLGGLPGGWSTVTDTSAVGVQKCLGASLDRINSMSNSMNRLVDSNILSIEQQVVAGIKYRFRMQVTDSTCRNSGTSAGLTSVGCAANANSMMTPITWDGECVYVAWDNDKTTVLKIERNTVDVDIAAGDQNTDKLLVGDGHDQVSHGQGLLGADGHDLLKHGGKLLGGDGHDMKPHGGNLLGGDTHDLVDHVKNLFGGDGHDLVQHGKELLGGDNHDVVNHVKNLLGGDGHDIIEHGKKLLGGDNHDLVNHVKNLLGRDGHDMMEHGKKMLGGDGHDQIQHALRNMIGQDGHDMMEHRKKMIGQDGHDMMEHGKKMIGQDGHDSQPHGTQTDGSNDCQIEMFEEFKKNHNKLYGSQEEDGKRYKIFCDNMRRARKIQEIEQGTARYGPTKFADLTKSEFRQYVGKKWDVTAAKGMKKADIPKGPIPESFDWREHGAVTGVKNQGSCGSCWAFSTTGNIEGQWAIKKRKLISLSEQELVDCDKVDEGCNGGLPTNAYKEIERLGGLETETEYSYKGEGEKCEFKKSDVKVYINDSVSISSNETDMAAWLAANGPISIGINAFAMQYYMGGISHPWSIFCNPSDLDHGVLIVGYGVQGSKPYWIVKNSWGPDWGEKGYYLVYRGAGVCGLNKMCTSSVVN